MIERSALERRQFLRVGALGVVLAAGGCGSDGNPEQVTTPPVTGGNRNRMKAILEKAEQNAQTKKK
jgi:hypothetical protein